MRLLVPLAGPDFVRPDGSVKAQQVVEGRPLLRAALESRPWAAAVASTDYVFVLRDTEATRRFATEDLESWYPGCGRVFLSAYTRGAALSALAGVALTTDEREPVIIDLADILYQTDADPAAVFAAEPGCGGVALTFPSDHPAYSYLRADACGRIVEAAEKRVISGAASAGTYAFASIAVVLRAVAHALEHAAEQTHNGLFFVCPLLNGVLGQGLSVRAVPVTDVRDIKVPV